MLTSSLDGQEIQLLLVALRYWRSHRTDGVTRRTDPHITPDTLDVLMAKLASAAEPSAGPDVAGLDDASPLLEALR